MRTIQSPEATCEFLRFKVGRDETRPENIPQYTKRSLVGYKKGAALSVFRLLGFGSTLEAAEQMAQEAQH